MAPIWRCQFNDSGQLLPGTSPAIPLHSPSLSILSVIAICISSAHTAHMTSQDTVHFTCLHSFGHRSSPWKQLPCVRNKETARGTDLCRCHLVQPSTARLRQALMMQHQPRVCHSDVQNSAKCAFTTLAVVAVSTCPTPMNPRCWVQFRMTSPYKYSLKATQPVRVDVSPSSSVDSARRIRCTASQHVTFHV